LEFFFIYCGVFTPRKNCNIETRSRDYATVNEAVFSPCRAEQSRTKPSRAEPNRAEPSRGEPSQTERNRAENESLIASHRLTSLLPDNSYKHLDNARVGNGQVAGSAVTQQLKRFPACQIQGFIGVPRSSSQEFRQIARRVLLLENSSAVSAQRRPGVRAGISKLMRIRLGGYTSLVFVDRLSLNSH
jgi:hypothetical protein